MGVCDIGNFKSSLHCVYGAIFQLIQLIILVNWDVLCCGDRLCHGLELNVATAPTNTASSRTQHHIMAVTNLPSESEIRNCGIETIQRTNNI